MPVTDTIRPFRHALYVEFAGTGNTGRVSTLRLDRGLTLCRNGLQLDAHYHGGEAAFIVETFASEVLASNGLQALRGAVQRYARRQRMVGAAKAAVLWGLVPVAAVLFGLALNAAAARQGGALPALAAMQPLPAPPGQLAAAAAAAPGPVQPPRADVAQGLANAARSGKFSVRLSEGNAGTIYVFSDPGCPHCRTFERELEALASRYTVVLFPVSVIGGASSAGRIAELLCAEPAARGGGWKALIAGGKVDKPTQCTGGPPAVEANDQVFRALGLRGTPSIVAVDGRIMPDTVALNAQGVDGWMRETPSQ